MNDRFQSYLWGPFGAPRSQIWLCSLLTTVNNRSKLHYNKCHPLVSIKHFTRWFSVLAISSILLTVFFNLDTQVIFIPAMIAIRELKLPMFMHSFATSTKYSMIRTRFFFFKCCNTKKTKFIIIHKVVSQCYFMATLNLWRVYKYIA